MRTTHATAFNYARRMAGFARGEALILNTSPDASEIVFADRDCVQQRLSGKAMQQLPLRYAYGNEIDPRCLPEAPRRVFG